MTYRTYAAAGLPLHTAVDAINRVTSDGWRIDGLSFSDGRCELFAEATAIKPVYAPLDPAVEALLTHLPERDR